MRPMTFGSRHAAPSHRHSQCGQAMLLFVILVAVGITALVYHMIDPQAGALRLDRNTMENLAKAKDALIGYAAGSATLPGQLPCPDTNNDGVAEPLDGNGNCLSDGGGNPLPVIGRLPWKTLGIEDIRDSAGERLWYAPFVTFTRALSTFTSCPPTCFDSDTKGGLTVSQDKAVTVVTSEAIAVIFAPGPAVLAQVRDPANANNSANYLETWDLVNNAIAAGPFISAQASPTFNDKLFIITTAQLWTIVEQRIAREMLKLLSQYRTTTTYYPWASDNFDDDSVSGSRRGMAPMEDALPDTWVSLGIGVPAYIKGSDSKWGRLVYYAVAECATQGAPIPPGCSTLTVDGVNKDLVLITPGPADASRPSGTLSDYVKDPVNNDNNDLFVTPASTAYTRNRIYTCPGTPGIC